MEQSEVSQFLAYLRNEKRYSPHTRQAYERDLAEFNLFAQEHSIKCWSDVRAQHIRAFIAVLNRDSQNPQTIQRKLSTLRSFYRYLMREGSVRQNPAEGIKAPKKGKKLPRVIDVDQMQALLSINPQDDIMFRDAAMLELFYGCGLRLSELANLDVSDIDFAQSQIRITGKGSKTRIVPMGKQAIHALQQWLKIRSEWAINNQKALFLSKRGQRISNRSIQSRLSHWGAKLGLGTNLHPHRLRHSFASHLLESSGDIRAVQELLGHSQLSTTQIYTHLDFQHLAQVYDKAHPRAKKK